MKAIYSFWTKPYRDNNGKLHGSLTNMFMINCLALSVSYARRLFDSVELITDCDGKAMFEPLGIFDKVDTSLEALDNINPKFWAAGKILAYMLQDEPFLHLDYDVFLKTLRPEMLHAKLVCQHKENFRKHAFYPEAVKMIKDWGYESNLLYTPIKAALNCGIFGGNDIDFIKRYTTEADKLILWMNDRPELFDQFDDVMKKFFSCVFEQYSLAASAEFYKVNPLEVWENEDNRMANYYGYTHLWGYKDDPNAAHFVANILKNEFPEMNKKILYYVFTRNEQDRSLINAR